MKNNFLTLSKFDCHFVSESTWKNPKTSKVLGIWVKTIHDTLDTFT